MGAVASAAADVFFHLKATLSQHAEVNSSVQADLGVDVLNDMRVNPNFLNGFLNPSMRTHVGAVSVDTGGASMMMVAILLTLAGCFYAFLHAHLSIQLTASLGACMCALVTSLSTDSRHPRPVRNKKGKDANTGEALALTPLLSEHEMELKSGNTDDIMLFREVLIPHSHENIADYVTHQSTLEVVKVPELLGGIQKILHAAVTIMGKDLKKESNAQLKQGIDSVQAAVTKHRAVILNQVKFSRQVMDQVVPDWERLAKKMEKQAKKESGWLGLSELRVDDEKVKVKYDKTAKEDLAELENSDTSCLRVEDVAKLYADAQNILRDSMQDHVSSFPTFPKELKDAEEKIRKRASEVAALKQQLIEANRDKVFAEASNKAYKEVKDSGKDMESRLKEMIRQKDQDLQAAEKRVRDYTFKMWGRWVGMWENDVKLAKEEVGDIKKEIALLEVRLTQHKDNMSEASKVKDGEFKEGDMGAFTEARVRQTADVVKAIEVEHTKALDDLKEAENDLGKLMQRLEDKLKEEGVSSLNELEVIKKITGRITQDNLILEGITQVSTSPFSVLKNQMLRVLKEMKTEDTVAQQAEHLRAFVNMANLEDDTQARKTEWQRILGVYASVDTTKFSQLLSGALECRPSQNPASAQADIYQQLQF